VIALHHLREGIAPLKETSWQEQQQTKSRK